jgi:dienelactone hydrolase
MINAVRRTLALGLLIAPLTGCDATGGPVGTEHDDASSPSASHGDSEGDASSDDTGALDGGREEDDARDGAAPDSDGGDASAEGRARDSRSANAADAALSGPRVDSKDPQLYELALDPHMLDPGTVDSLSTQYAQLDTRTVSLGKLVIFLPGANNVPRDWRDHGRKLAEFGFHVLIPHYNNRWSSNDTCTGMGNACADNTRWEALTGEDSSSAIAIARADSAEGRVVTMIKHLMSANAAGDWGYYLAGEQLAYGKIVIAGISHGAASAGMYAARRPFARNVMHSSGPAGSSSGTKMTPLSEWYAFAHTADDAYSAIIASWSSFAIPGQPTSIDGKMAPYGNSHRLITSASSTYPHGSVVVHSSSPKDAAGKYLFEEAWRYLYGVSASAL